MRHLSVLCVAFCLLASTLPAQAQQLVDSYRALLSERDHFNSSGARLTSAAAIIRQDRANFHRFGRRDAADESDRFFASIANRARLEQMLDAGSSSAGALDAIVNGTPFVLVEIYRNPNGTHAVRVLVQ